MLEMLRAEASPCCQCHPLNFHLQGGWATANTPMVVLPRAAVGFPQETPPHTPTGVGMVSGTGRGKQQRATVSPHPCELSF